jgi:hypothetical protein
MATTVKCIVFYPLAPFAASGFGGLAMIFLLLDAQKWQH